MAYRYDSRHHVQLLPQSIEDYVSINDPVILRNYTFCQAAESENIIAEVHKEIMV